MDKGSSRRQIPTILNRRHWHRYFSRFAIICALFAGVGVFIYTAVNPTDRNHIVIIGKENVEHTHPLHATLNGGISWKQSLRFYGGWHRQDGRSLSVANVANPWWDGRLSITDNQGTEIASVEIRPHGRYCGALVIVIDEDGQLDSAWWNAMPTDEL